MNLFDVQYDSYLCYALYVEYCYSGCKKTVEELCRQICGLIGLVARCYYIESTVCESDAYVIKSEALEHIYSVFYYHLAPLENEKVFRVFMWRTAYNAIVDSVRKSIRPPIDYYVVCSEPFTGQLDSHDDAEIRIYVEQVRRVVLEVVRSQIRFDGAEKKACIFIAKSLLGFIKISPSAATGMFRLKKNKLKFLEQYVQILIRRATMMVREIEADG